MTEADTQSQILDYLKLQKQAGKLDYWRVGLGALKHGGARKKNPMKGHPDIAGFLIPSGRYFGIEVKTPTGKFYKEQVEWVIRFNKGALHIIAERLEDVVGVLG